MFHLLVSYQGWPEGAGTLPNSRVKIYPNESPGSEFFTNGKLDSGKIGQIPALLVTETGGSGPQIARVAYITGISNSGQDTVIRYSIDSSLPSISNDDLGRFASLLGLNKFVLTHSHWAVKEADLFRILLMNQRRLVPAPKVFSLSAFSLQEPDLVSVMMPFSAEFNSVYDAIQTAVSACGLVCKRADDIWEHPEIIQDVVNLIAKARVVISDCSGRNPNVFYESGIAHAIGKEVILITQSESDIPFDLRHLRHVRYLNNGEGRAELTKALESRINFLVS